MILGRTFIATIGFLALVSLSPAAQAIDGGPAPKDPPGVVDETAVTSSTEIVTPGTAETADPAVRTNESYCRRVTAKATAKSVGVTVFWLQQRVTWCYTGTKVIFRYRFPTQSYANGYLLWSDDDSPDVTTSHGTPWFVNVTKRFRHCPPAPWDVGCTNKYADIDLTLKANGLYVVDQDIR